MTIIFFLGLLYSEHPKSITFAKDKLLLTNDMLKHYLLIICVWICTQTSAENVLTADRITVEQGLPSNNINDILQDSHGYIWMATDNGLCRYDGGTFVNFSATKDSTNVGLTDNRIVALAIDAQHQRLFIRSFTGVYSCFDLNNGTFIPCTAQEAKAARPRTPHWKTGLRRSASPAIYAIDTQGREQTLALPQSEGPVSKRHKLYATETANGQAVYMAVGSHIYWAERGGGSIHRLSAITELLPPMSTLSNILIDHSGTLWLCSRYCGVTKISWQAIQADLLCPELKATEQDANNVRLVLRTDDSHVMVSTKDGELAVYNPANGTFSDRHKLDANAYAYLKDSRGRIWIGTKGDGLYINGTRYSAKDHNIPIHNSDIYDLTEDAQGRVWIATYGGGLLMAKTLPNGSIQFVPYLTGDLRKSRVRRVVIDRNQQLWVGTNNGLYIIDTRKKEIREREFCSYNSDNSNLPDRDVLSVIFDRNDQVWIATYGGGLAYCRFPTDYTHIKLKALTRKDGLPNNNIRSMIEDRYGYLWLGTDDGLVRLSPTTLHINEYKLSKNMLANNFSENATAMLPNGDLLMGTSYGLWRIQPTVPHTRESRVPDITCMTVNGHQIYGGAAWLEAIAGKAPLTLSHEENAVTFHFSNFSYAHRPHYRYYMEPLENTWHSVTTEASAIYDHLKPGHYTFHVQAYGLSGQWSKERTISLHIREPWYNTWWMWAIYVCVALGIAFVFARIQLGNLRLRNRLRVEKSIMAFRINFFTHIAHEFRTPIAIIRTAVDAIAHADKTQREQLGHNIKAARRGTNRLSRLVDNLLLFRKINEGHMHLHVSRGNIVEFLRQIYTDFFPYADSRNIKMQLVLPSSPMPDVLFDTGKVEIIFSNILSNAIKYAPEKSSVVIRIKALEDRVTVTVADEGPGISADQQANLFKPFMQGLTSAGGMGIGLYLAHSLALSHHGTLTYADNKAMGHGAVFAFSLPTGSNSYTSEEQAPISKPAQQEQTDTEAPKEEEDSTLLSHVCADPINGHVKVYLVEDDTDMMSQLRSELSVYFNVITFSNGKEALEALSDGTDRPALIISDVIMPQMNGIELTKAVKQQRDTMCIGVILLSSLDTEENRMQAVKAGADDFFTKPCPLQMLVTRCFRLIKNQQNLTTSQQKAQTTEEPLVESVVDRNFKNKVETIIASHLTDDDFTVDSLAEQLGWGRSVVYRRVKQLFGMTPNDYIRNKRMERAARLIEEGGHTIAEISLMVGIKDPAYFNRCFKKQFGMPPSKYGK